MIKNYKKISLTKNTRNLTVRLLEKMLYVDYLDLNPDLQIAEVDPLTHFLSFGINENRLISQLMDINHLIEISQIDNIKIEKHASEIFFSQTNETILPNKWMDLEYISENNKGFKNSSPIEIILGLYDGEVQNITPLFCQEFYSEQLKDRGIKTHLPFFLHYIKEGWKKNLEPHPLFDSLYFSENNDKEITQPPLLIYFELLNSKHNLSVSPFVDLDYLNHKIQNFNYKKYKKLTLLENVIASAKTIPANFLNKSISPFLTSYLRQNSDFDLDNFSEDDNINDLISILFEIRFLAKDLQINSKDSKLSVIIVNYHKTVMTLLCVYSVLKSLRKYNYEIIIVDNESNSYQCEILHRYLNAFSHIKIWPSEKNLYFGEANNIAIDMSDGEHIMFLNNDAFINENLIDSMQERLQTNADVGVVGPMFFDASLKVSEFGGLVSDFGDVIQQSRGVSLNRKLLVKFSAIGMRRVNYVSAACMLVRSEVLKKTGGFDYVYEPFYYEDTDLCMRLKSQQIEIAADGNAACLHLENTSTKELLKDSFNQVVSRSKRKFTSRWSISSESSDKDYICNHGNFNDYFQFSDKYTANASNNKKLIGVYTPFGVALGGGENYILSIASALADDFRVVVITDEVTSTSRYGFIFRDLGIEYKSISIATKDDVSMIQFDLTICLGNQINPSWIPNSKYLIYICQFPYPMHEVQNLNFARQRKIDLYLVYSHYVKLHTQLEIKKYNLKDSLITIQHPPCNLSNKSIEELIYHKTQVISKTNMISVGRFFTGGHCKNQLLIAKAMRSSIHDNGRDLLGYIYGALNQNPAHIDYYMAALDYKIDNQIIIDCNVPITRINEGFYNSHYYIHAAGLNQATNFHPQRAEHFGITAIEAMSYGCIPIVFNAGGVADLVRQSGVGYLYSSEAELLAIINHVSLIDRGTPAFKDDIQKAYEFSLNFSRIKFNENIKKIVIEKINAY